MCEDLGQLKALLQRAFRLISGRRMPSRIAEVFSGIDALQQNAILSAETPVVAEICQRLKAVEQARAVVKKRLAADKDPRLPDHDYRALLARVAEGDGITEALDAILSNQLALCSEQNKQYWARTLCETAADPDDQRVLVGTLRSSFDQAHTAARKALRFINAITHGPPMALEDA
jgi:hypothetical protein